MDLHRRAAVPDVVMAAQKHPGDSVILQAAVPEVDHTQMARLAGNASPSCQTCGLTSPRFNFLLCGTQLTQCFRRATLNSRPQTARRGSTQSSVGEASSSTHSASSCVCFGTNTPQISIPDKDIMTSATGRQ